MTGASRLRSITAAYWDPFKRSPAWSDACRGLLHSERALCLSRKELPHELVVGVEQLAGRSRLHDAALPQHGDVVGHAAGGHDVVGDHHVGAAVLLVDLLDQLAQEGGAHGVEA